MKVYWQAFLFLLGLSVLAQEKWSTDTLDILELNPYRVDLPGELSEISGLVYTKKGLWGFNDSGGAAEIYKIDPSSGEIMMTVALKNASNVDWEDIAADDEYIYVGDIGNNFGHRKDLKIYRIAQKDIVEGKKRQKVAAQAVEFYYPEQTSYERQDILTTNFDAETLVVIDGKLYLYTKEWSSYCTTQYEIDFSPGDKKAAKLISVFDAEAAVTAGDYDDDTLYLTAYTVDGAVFLWRIKYDAQNKVIERKKFVIGISPMLGQLEALAIQGDQLFLGSEYFDLWGFEVNQRLYKLPTQVFD